MRRQRKSIERLLKRPPIQIRLRLRIIRIALRVDLIPAGAKQRRGEHLRDGAQQAHGEVDRGGRGKTQLARGRLVRVRRPGRRLGARDVLRVRLGDGRGVPWRVDFLCVHHHVRFHCGEKKRKRTYDENVDSALRGEINNKKVRKGRGTHCAGVGHDVGDVLRGVDGVGAICALLRDVRVIGHDEREALAVDDMPVERIDLQ